MKKWTTLLILSIVILFTFNESKGCEIMATYTDQELARLIRDGKINTTQAQSEMNKLKGGATPSNGTTVASPTIGATITPTPIIGGGPKTTPIPLDTSHAGEGVLPDADQPFPTADPYAEMMAQYQAEQQRLAEAQRQSRISALGKAKDNALSGLDSEKATIDPYYYDKRNEAASASDVGAMNFAQYMAGRGIKGSAGAMPEMYRNAGLQNQVGRLDKQQAAEHSDIERRKSGINSAYESDVAGANADIDAQTMQNYITQMQTVQAQRIADQAAQGLTSTGQQTLQGRTAQNSEYERQAALLAAQNYDNIQAKIDELSAANPNDPLIPYLYTARRQKIQTQAEQQAAAMAAASEAEQQAYENAFKLFESVGRITSPEQAQILGLPQNATAADIDIARMNAQTSRINATKPSGSAGSTTTKPTLSANNYDDYIKTNIDLTNSAAIESYLTQLLNSGVDESIVNALAAKYGV